MCAGATSDGRPVRERGTGRGWWEPHPPVHRRADRVLQALGNGDRLELRVGTPTRHGRSPSPAATRSGPRRHRARSTAWSTCAGRARTSTGGNRPVARAGAGITCAGPTSNSKNCVLPRVPEDTNELSQVFIDAAQEVGFRFNPFFDDGDLEGCGWNRMSVHQGQRQSSYRAFVEPVLDRSNLHLITDAVVDRLEVSKTGAVTGLNVHEAAGHDRRLGAGEVILCAGAYESPRLLMLSGIGPASTCVTATSTSWLTFRWGTTSRTICLSEWSKRQPGRSIHCTRT